MGAADGVDTGDDYAAANDDLLARLAAAKAAHGAFSRHKELLRDPAISRLVYALAAQNTPWIEARVRSEKALLVLRDSQEELVSLALSGSGGGDADVRGVIGAILQYDHGRFGVRSFTRYLARAIHNALVPRQGQQREARQAASLARTGPSEWADRRQRQPRELAIDAELMGVLSGAIEALPSRNRAAAEYIVGYVLEHGERPTGREVGESRDPPVSKQAGEVLMKQTLDRLKEVVEELNPQLAEDGVGGWKQFSEVFGIHKHRQPGASR
jgi:hypothetical protein